MFNASRNKILTTISVFIDVFSQELRCFFTGTEKVGTAEADGQLARMRHEPRLRRGIPRQVRQANQNRAFDRVLQQRELPPTAEQA